MSSNRTWRGTSFGGPSDTYQITSEEGLDDLIVRSASAPLPRYHGAIPGDHTADQKKITLSLWWHHHDLGEAEELGRIARALFQPSRETQFEYGFTHQSGLTGVVFARVVRRSQPRSVATEAVGLFTMDVAFEVTDPALYGPLDELIVNPAAPAEGLEYPVDYPKQYGAAGSGGSVFSNTGDWETWPVFQISGPSSGTLTDPSIIAPTLNKQLALTANGGVAIQPGQVLEISTHPRNRYVQFTTGASRYGKLSPASEFFALPPGDTELRFQASGDTTDAAVTVQARPAWL